jgi:hypothetical protein
MKLIASKITIPAETPRVCRQGLLDTLRENLESCHATVIEGRAGTGKTMLAANGSPGIGRASVSVAVAVIGVRRLCCKKWVGT